MNEQNDPSEIEEFDEEEFDEVDIGFDWIVFFGRISALLVFGATLGTSFEVSFNQGAEWATVMRLAIQPFALGVVILVLVEMLDRRRV